MHRFLKTRFVDRWLWLCPGLSLVLATVVLLLFGFTFWGALLTALLLACPTKLRWGVILMLRDEHRLRVVGTKGASD